MKGHVGGGPGRQRLQGAGGSVKLSRSMFRYISTVICDVQERLLESRPWRFAVFPAGAMVGHKLESLILAQNERWRHA